MAYPMIMAKSISYGGSRSLSSIKYIVIHYTGNIGDTAKGNATYFGPAGTNTRAAGAHYFVDQKGEVYQSIPINLSAWSVGGFFTQANGAGTYYNKCTNYNSVSIEMCDTATKDASTAMVNAMRTLVSHIKSQCPNAKTIIRHWDVNGKECPQRYIGKNNSKWAALVKAITSAASEKVYAEGEILYGQEIYESPNGKNTKKYLPPGTVVKCYGTFTDNKIHSDGLRWVWWRIGTNQWVVYTKRIKKSEGKIYAKGIIKYGQQIYSSPNGANTKKFLPAGTEVNCYGTFTDKVKHPDGLNWVWWRIGTNQWVVYTRRITKL